MITDLPERGKASLKDFLQKIERGQIASTLPDDDMTWLQGTKPRAAVTQTYSDNQAEVTFWYYIITLIRSALVLLFPSLQIWVMFVNSDVSFGS